MCMKPVLNVVPFEPGLLIKPADGGHDCQEEQTEHEIGLRAQSLVQKMAAVEEQERCEDNGESPGTQHQDMSILVHLLSCVLMGRLCRHDLFFLLKNESMLIP
jgi:hypothetical protein